MASRTALATLHGVGVRLLDDLDGDAGPAVDRGHLPHLLGGHAHLADVPDVAAAALLVGDFQVGQIGHVVVVGVELDRVLRPGSRTRPEGIVRTACWMAWTTFMLDRPRAASLSRSSSTWTSRSSPPINWTSATPEMTVSRSLSVLSAKS